MSTSPGVRGPTGPSFRSDLLRPAVERAFSDSVLAREGWIRSDAVLRELRDGARRGQVPQHLWYLYVLEEWLRAERAGGAAASRAPRAA